MKRTDHMTDFASVQQKIGLEFNNEQLLETALTHRSFLNENKNSKVSNERLEFLGDSVLGVLVSTELYNLFPNHPEGKLTMLRSLLVKTKTLAEISKSLDLGNFLQMSKGEEKSGGRNNPSLLADTFEALLGAVYLDQGIEPAREFIKTHLFPLIPEIQKSSTLTDSKSALQEITQEKFKTSPTYKVLAESGPDHDKTFSVGAFMNEQQLAVGHGKSKQEAEQEAANLALQTLKV